MKRVLLWDLDGTLVVWRSRWLIPYVAWLHLRALGRRHGAVRTLVHVGGAYRAMLANQTDDPNDRLFVAELARRLGVPRQQVEAEEAVLVEEGMEDLAGWIEPVIAARALFRELVAEGRFRMVAATNPTMPQRFNAKRLGWAGYDVEHFELITGTETSTRLKGSPRFYFELLERLGVAPEVCLMIGNDGRKDLPAAAAGIPVFLLRNGHEVHLDAHPDLSPAGSGDYRELRRFLDGWAVEG